MNERSSRMQCVGHVTLGLLMLIVHIAEAQPQEHWIEETGSATHAATTWYVATDGDDANAGTNWVTAKATIQAGIDTASEGDTVLVGDGTYAPSSEITIDKGVHLRSVGGRNASEIRGRGYPYQGRCLSMLAPNAVVDGFTIANGYINTSPGGAGVST